MLEMLYLLVVAQGGATAAIKGVTVDTMTNPTPFSVDQVMLVRPFAR